MSKRTFRLILTGYLAFETATSFYNALFGIRVPSTIVGQLYGIFGQPVALPQWIAVSLGGLSIVVFTWAIIGLYLFWPSARLVFIVVLITFVAIAPLKPFYIISGWFEVFMHLRFLFHGFIICLVYFGPPAEYFAARSPNQSPQLTAGCSDD